MEGAAKHVIPVASLSEECKRLMTEFPTAALDFANSGASPKALLQLLKDGDVHIVEKICAGKSLQDRLDEQPNAVHSTESHIQLLHRELNTVSELLDKHLDGTLQLFAQVLRDADFKSEIVENFWRPTMFKCIAQMARSFKARVVDGSQVDTSIT